MQKHLDIIRPQQQTKKTKLSRKQMITLLVAAAMLLAVVVVVMCVYRANLPSAFIRKDTYQAVFLTNNQVYFGKLQQLGDQSTRLTEIYYPKAQQSAAGAKEGTDSSAQDKAVTNTDGSQLMKFGSELLGAEDQMIFQNSQVSYWVNLKSDSKVVQAIEAYTKKQQ